MNKIRFLSGNALKIIGAITMLIDHMGLILFPYVAIFRIIGRLAFPIFAFMISEGAKYTKNKLRYFLTIFIVGVLCQIPYILVANDMHLNTFITFSLSIILIYSLDFFKKALFAKDCEIVVKIFSLMVFLTLCLFTYLLTTKVHQIHIDYGLYGAFMAVFASLPSLSNTDAPSWLKRLDCLPVRILCMLIPMLLYCRASPDKISIYSLLSLVLLFLYSGKRGKTKMKYFFYIFYPAHIVALYAISLII